MKDKDTKALEMLMEEVYRHTETDFDKILTPSERQRYYKTSAMRYSDIEFLGIVWRMPLDKLETLISLLESDRETAIRLGRFKSIISKLYRRDEMWFESYLKFAKGVLKARLKNEPMPDWLE